MRNVQRLRITGLLLLSFLLITVRLSGQETAPGSWYLSSIKVPENLASKLDEPLVVAVVDDAVRTTHSSIAEYIYVNAGEKPGNSIDDDGNGLIDDTNGWDVSDRDGNVTPPADRAAEYYHGTHLASIVIRIVEAAYGSSAHGIVRILPVKSISDLSSDFYLRDGYAGIEYAINAGADIVLTSWGVGRLNPEEEQVLDKAEQAGVLIVASGGNLPEEQEQFPAAHPSVLAVAATGPDGKKVDKSNYGAFIDISAPGIDIGGADSISDTALRVDEGSSFAAAVAAGAALIVKSRNPELSWVEVTASLKSSADPYPEDEEEYRIKLGAGRLNIAGAIETPITRLVTEPDSILDRAHGYIRTEDQGAWTVSPDGHVKGIRLSLPFARLRDSRGTVTVYPGSGVDPIGPFDAQSFPETLYVPGTSLRVEATPDSGDIVIAYTSDPVDLSTLYCGGTRFLDREGSFEDGSGPEQYANGCDCKWVITAPEGKVIHFIIEEFNTEPVVDKVYFFNGAGTHEMIMAIFSGSNPPSELTTWSNQVLVWFVTDRNNRGEGWKLSYTFVDP